MSIAHKLQDKKRTDDVLISETVDFSGLLLSKPVLDGLIKAGFQKPSPIQLKAIPLGRCGLDLIVQAKSGTGKTCVFSVVALESLDIAAVCIQVLVLTPTREIALQVQEVVRTIGLSMVGLKCHTFIGGLPVLQDKIIAKNCHIAVGTPGRIKQLIEIGVLKTNSIRLFVLDEADKLLEGDFQETINWIYSMLPENKQMLALSATYPEYLANHLTSYMRNPTFVRLNITDPALLGIKQYHVVVPYHPMPNIVFNAKTEVVVKILSSVSFQQCLIFSNMQTRAQNLQSELQARNWPTACIAGCLDQKERNFAMEQLKTYKCRILISTDLTSRGIDADKVNLVINMDVPLDHETYLHRIGRAGRFGSFGAAITIVSACGQDKELWAVEKKCKTYIHKLSDPIPKDLVTKPVPVNINEVVSTEQIFNKPTEASLSLSSESLSLDLSQETNVSTPGTPLTDMIPDIEPQQQETVPSQAPDNSLAGVVSTEMTGSPDTLVPDHSVLSCAEGETDRVGLNTTTEDLVLETEIFQAEVQHNVEASESSVKSWVQSDIIDQQSFFSPEGQVERTSVTESSIVQVSSIAVNLIRPESKVENEEIIATNVSSYSVTDDDDDDDERNGNVRLCGNEDVNNRVKGADGQCEGAVEVGDVIGARTVPVVVGQNKENGENPETPFSLEPGKNNAVRVEDCHEDIHTRQSISTLAENISEKVLLHALTSISPLQSAKTKAFQLIGYKVPSNIEPGETDDDPISAELSLGPAKDETNSRANFVEQLGVAEMDLQNTNTNSSASAKLVGGTETGEQTDNPSIITVDNLGEGDVSPGENKPLNIPEESEFYSAESTPVTKTDEGNMGSDETLPEVVKVMDGGQTSHGTKSSEHRNSVARTILSQNVTNDLVPSMQDTTGKERSSVDSPQASPQLEKSASSSITDAEQDSTITVVREKLASELSAFSPGDSPNTRNEIGKAKQRQRPPRSFAVSDFMRSVNDSASSFQVPKNNKTLSNEEDKLAEDLSLSSSLLSRVSNTDKGIIKCTGHGDANSVMSSSAKEVISSELVTAVREKSLDIAKSHNQNEQTGRVCPVVTDAGDRVNSSEITNSTDVILQHPSPLGSSGRKLGTVSGTHRSDSENPRALQSEDVGISAVEQGKDTLEKNNTSETASVSELRGPTALPGVSSKNVATDFFSAATPRQVTKAEKSVLASALNSLLLQDVKPGDSTDLQELAKNQQTFCAMYEKKLSPSRSETELLKLLVPLDFTYATDLQDLCAFELAKLTELKSKFQKKLEIAEKERQEALKSAAVKDTPGDNGHIHTAHERGKQTKSKEKYKAPRGKQPPTDSFEDALRQYQKARQAAEKEKRKKENEKSKPSDSLDWRKDSREEIHDADHSRPQTPLKGKSKTRNQNVIDSTLASSSQNNSGIRGAKGEEQSIKVKQPSVKKTSATNNPDDTDATKTLSVGEQSQIEIQQLDDMHANMLKRRQERKAEKLRLQKQAQAEEGTKKAEFFGAVAQQSYVETSNPAVEVVRQSSGEALAVLEPLSGNSQENPHAGKEEPPSAERDLSAKKVKAANQDNDGIDTEDKMKEKLEISRISIIEEYSGIEMDDGSNVISTEETVRLGDQNRTKEETEKTISANLNMQHLVTAEIEKNDRNTEKESGDKDSCVKSFIKAVKKSTANEALGEHPGKSIRGLVLEQNIRVSSVEEDKEQRVKKNFLGLSLKTNKSEKQTRTSGNVKKISQNNEMSQKENVPDEQNRKKVPVRGPAVKGNHLSKLTTAHCKPSKPSKTEARLAGIEVSDGSTSSTSSDLSLSSTSDISDVPLSELDKTTPLELESHCYANRYASDEGTEARSTRFPDKKVLGLRRMVDSASHLQQAVQHQMLSSRGDMALYYPGRASSVFSESPRGQKQLSVTSHSDKKAHSDDHQFGGHFLFPTGYDTEKQKHDHRSRKKSRESGERPKSPPLHDQHRGESSPRRRSHPAEKSRRNDKKRANYIFPHVDIDAERALNEDLLSSETSGSESGDEDSPAQQLNPEQFHAYNQHPYYSGPYPYFYPQFTAYPGACPYQHPTGQLWFPVQPYGMPLPPSHPWPAFPYWPSPVSAPPSAYMYQSAYPSSTPYNANSSGCTNRRHPQSASESRVPHSTSALSQQLHYVTLMSKQLSHLVKKYKRRLARATYRSGEAEA